MKRPRIKRAMCIWLPRWPLERLAAARLELNGRAVLVYEAAPRGGLKVVDYCPCLEMVGNSSQSALTPALSQRERELRQSRPARGTAIRPGMPLAEAIALADWEREQYAEGSRQKAGGRSTKYEVRRTKQSDEPTELRIADFGLQIEEEQLRSVNPQSAIRNLQSKQSTIRNPQSDGLHLELDDPTADRLALEDLAQWCQRFSPAVGIESSVRPECLLLDITGLGTLAGGEAALAAEVCAAFEMRGLAARVAIADSIGAAWAVGHFGEKRAGRSTKYEVRRTKENDECGAMNDELTLLDKPAVAPDPQSKIHNPQFFIVPAGQTSQALAGFPIAALRLEAEAIGLLSELGIRSIAQLAALGRSTLSSRFGAGVLERLDQAMGAVPETIGARKFAPELEIEWDFEYPTDRRESIELALEKLLGRLVDALAPECKGALHLECRFCAAGCAPLVVELGLFRPSATPGHLIDLVRLRLERLRFTQPISSVRVVISRTGLLEFHQQPLFDSGPVAVSSWQLASLVDRLSSRLGRDAVVRPWRLADAQPEHACQYLPMTGLPARRKQSTKRAVQDRLGACDRPLRLYTRPMPLEVVAVAPDGPPVQFRHEGRDERILFTWGPERIETGWWRSRCVRRDYYRVETAHGSRFWLFRRLQDGRWFLQGQFE